MLLTLKQYYPYVANNGKNKYYIITNEGKKIYFGQYGASDYTIHKDPERKLRYLKRHSNEDWYNFDKAAAWSRWLLWNKPTIKASYIDIKRRFIF